MVQTPAVRQIVVMADTHLPSENKRQVAVLTRLIGVRKVSSPLTSIADNFWTKIARFKFPV